MSVLKQGLLTKKKIESTCLFYNTCYKCQGLAKLFLNVLHFLKFLFKLKLIEVERQENNLE